MDERLDKISEQLARVLSILDAKEHKKQVDRDRIKSKREEDAVETAKKRGAIGSTASRAPLRATTGCPTRSGPTYASSSRARWTFCDG